MCRENLYFKFLWESLIEETNRWDMQLSYNESIDISPEHLYSLKSITNTPIEIFCLNEQQKMHKFVLFNKSSSTNESSLNDIIQSTGANHQYIQHLYESTQKEPTDFI
jgi:hypothetical protein